MTLSTRTLGILLGGSVLLNVFFVGVLAARRFGPPPFRGVAPGEFGPPPRGSRAPAERKLLRETVQLLGGPRSDRVAPILGDHRRGRVAFERELRSAEREAREAMLAVPHDAKLFEAKLEALGALEDRGRREAHRALGRLSALLDDDDRQRLREKLQREPAED